MAGLMGNPIAYKGTINMAQADSLTDTGIYFINGTSSSNALTNDGTLVMFKGHNYTQTFYSSSNPIAAYIRRRVGTTGDWTPWQRIDNFGYNSLAELAGGVASEISPLTYLGYFNNETPYDSILKSGYGFSTPDDGSGILGHFIIMVYASSKAVIKIGISGNCKIRASDLNGEWSEWKLL